MMSVSTLQINALALWHSLGSDGDGGDGGGGVGDVGDGVVGSLPGPAGGSLGVGLESGLFCGDFD